MKGYHTPKTRVEIMWHLIEQVLDGALTADKARYILAGSGLLTEFDYQLKEFQAT